MARPLKRAKSTTSSEILKAASKLFIQKGYTETRIKDIAFAADVQYSEVFRLFGDKDTILSKLVGAVIEFQFIKTDKYLKDITDDKLLKFAFEAVLQLYVAESVEHIREMYVVSYSLPHSSNAIYRIITSKLQDIFKDSLPNFDTKDFYELEIAIAGIMRGYLSVPCDMYFTMDRKIRKYLEATFKLYNISEEKIEETISFIEQFNFQDIAYEVLNDLYGYLKNYCNK